jgi:hypothetical protein
MRKQGSGGGAIVEDVEKLNAVVKMTAGYSGSDLSAVSDLHYVLRWPRGILLHHLFVSLFSIFVLSFLDDEYRICNTVAMTIR